MNIANRARKLLINGGKILPFIVCAIVGLAYCEVLYATITGNYLHFHDYSILNTPINFAIASVFEYDLLIVVVLLCISFAIEACIYNTLAILYLALHLGVKAYIANMELTEISIYIFSIVNVIITSIIVIKGIKRMF